MTGIVGDMADKYSGDERRRIGRAVEAGRLNLGWGKEKAGREAGISSITWKRIEDGLGVQSVTLRSAEKALGWAPGTIDRIARDQAVRTAPAAPQGDLSARVARLEERVTAIAAILGSRVGVPELIDYDSEIVTTQPEQEPDRPPRPSRSSKGSGR